MKETKLYWYHNKAYSMEPYFVCLVLPNLLNCGHRPIPADQLELFIFLDKIRRLPEWYPLLFVGAYMKPRPTTNFSWSEVHFLSFCRPVEKANLVGQDVVISQIF